MVTAGFHAGGSAPLSAPPTAPAGAAPCSPTEVAPAGTFVHGAPAMARLIDVATRVAARDITVLVRGETGTGKEHVSEILHAGSPRSARPLVRFNCAALPRELADAELFGHARGAFTGAVGPRAGFFLQAHGSTLVLDEIGELPLDVQAKLLRALQCGEIQPVGSGRIERVDVRIVAATNRDLAAEVRAGRFREDLYYRLAVVELVVPPLRDRRDDIPALARELARRFGERFGLPGVSLEPALISALARADWPGNVRQLENMLGRLIALSSDGAVTLAHYRAAVGEVEAVDVVVEAEGEVVVPLVYGARLPLKQQVDNFERGLLTDALEASRGNQSEAARQLGVSRVTLIDKMKKHGLERKRF